MEPSFELILKMKQEAIPVIYKVWFRARVDLEVPLPIEMYPQSSLHRDNEMKKGLLSRLYDWPDSIFSFISYIILFGSKQIVTFSNHKNSQSPWEAFLFQKSCRVTRFCK